MSNLILNNAYRILGLTNNSSPRDILKRYKEIINRLKIDDRPRYDLDLRLPDDLRTEDSADDALKRLQNPKSKLTEYFFWYDVSDTVDENAFERLQYGDAASYDQAAQIWKKYSETENSTGLTYKKNLAILYCLCLFNEENDSFLNESVSIWDELVNSDRFWLSFSKKYEVSNGSGIHEDVLDNLRRGIAAEISDVYYDLHVHHSDTKYVRRFHDTFGIFGKRVEKHLFNPIHQAVYEIIEDLNGIEDKNGDEPEDATDTNPKCDGCGKISEKTPKSHFGYKDGSILCQECHKTMGQKWQKRIDSVETVEGSSKTLRQIEKDIERLKLNLERLQKIGLYDTDPSKIMRDHAAKAIRDVSITIHNQAHMREESLKLIDLAKEISTTADTKEKLESDSKTITEFITKDEEDALIIEIGLIRKKRLVVRGTFMEYGKSKIYYDDVHTILYYGSGGKYVFEIASSRDKISLKLDKSSGAVLISKASSLIERNYANSDEATISTAALISKASSLIEPRLISSLVKLIFENEEEVRVGKIRFDKTGYHRSRRLREDESVLWSEEIYIPPTPRLADGKCILYVDKNGSAKHFAAISLEEPNAIIVSELVKACHNEFHMRTQNGDPLTDLSEQTFERFKKNVAKKETQESKKTGNSSGL